MYNGRSSSYLGLNYAAEHIYCGNQIPGDYFSSSKAVFIKFKSDSSVAKSGFKLKATVVEGELIKKNGLIIFASYRKLLFGWALKAIKLIWFRFPYMNFSLGVSWLTLAHIYIWHRTADRLLISKNNHFKFFTGCYRNFTGIQGRIKLEESTDHCDIYIKAPVNYTLSLYYTDLMFSEYDCNKENIVVFDAHTNTSLQTICEFVGIGKSLFTNSNELRLRLKLNGYYTQVDITYLASTNGPGCGGDFYNTQGIFTNPFYPQHVRNNSDCIWNIRVPFNLKVLLKFPVFDLGAKSTCRTDYLQIIEHENINGSDVEKVMRQFCGEVSNCLSL